MRIINLNLIFMAWFYYYTWWVCCYGWYVLLLLLYMNIFCSLTWENVLLNLVLLMKNMLLFVRQGRTPHHATPRHVCVIAVAPRHAPPHFSLHPAQYTAPRPTTSKSHLHNEQCILGMSGVRLGFLLGEGFLVFLLLISFTVCVVRSWDGN